MKTNCALLIALLLTFASFAQVKKNKVLIGGQFGYFNEKLNMEGSGEQEYRNAVVSLSVGKAIKENSIVGLTFSYYPSYQKNTYTGNDSVSIQFRRYDAGVFYRKYKTLAKDFYFFTQADAAFISSTQKNSYSLSTGDVKTTQKGGFLSITPGISYQLFKKTYLEITIPNILSMQYAKTTVRSNNSQSKDLTDEQFLFYTSFANNNALGYLGVGFRFLL